MDQDEFWTLMQMLGSRPDDDFVRLTDELATRSPEDITDFDDKLTALLYALDTPAHAAAARAHGDWFLYVRCAAVAAGHSTYHEVLAEPAKLRRFARREAELLLSVARDAYERNTGMLWEHETAVSYESGSNASAWGDPAPSPYHPDLSAPVSWLTVHCVVFLPDGWPAAYPDLAYHVGEAVRADPAWDTWWAAAGIPECHLGLTLQADEAIDSMGTTVKVGRTRVEANAVKRPEPFTTTDPHELLPRAMDDVLTLLDAVRARLSLPPLPPLNPPELPADLPVGIEHPMTVRRLVADLGVGKIVRAGAALLFGRLRRRNQVP